MSARDWTPDVIKVAAIVTAAPRFVVALLRSEGYELPLDWLTWWVPVSAVLAVGMACLEGVAFAYVFSAWRRDRNNRLLWLALIAAALFVGMVAPSVAASVRSVSMAGILVNDWALAAWSVAVTGSTISIVAGVGYAQKPQAATQGSRKGAQDAPGSAQSARALAHVCAGCGASYESQQGLAAHMRFCHARKNGRSHQEPVQDEQSANP